MSQATLNSPSTFSESYTGSSSKSEASSIKAEKEFEDLTKDNVASPIDLECNIQEERLTKLLDDIIFKSKISIALPKLMQDVEFLATLLTPSDLGDIVFIFEQYDNPLFSSSMVDLGAMEDIKEGDISLKNRLNPELGHLLYIFNGCPELKAPIEAIINEMRSDYVSFMTQPPNPPLEFLLVMEHFRRLMIAQMNGTAAEELAAKLKVRKLEASNAALIKDIKEFTATTKREHDHFVKNIADKMKLIAKIEEEVNTYNSEATVKRKKKILDSDRQMVLMSRAHHKKDEMLQEEHVDVLERYETVLARHMQDEKAQRLRSARTESMTKCSYKKCINYSSKQKKKDGISYIQCKVETQLQSWLQKYDIDMGEKQIEIDEYTNMITEEVEKVADLEKALEEQNIEFLPLMEERENEYHQEMSNKMEQFQKEHAARVIQVCWRDVISNRAEKKKLKKMLVKKIAAEEAAAAAAAKAAAIAAKQASMAAKAAKKAEKQAAKEAKMAAKEKQLAEEAAAIANKKSKKQQALDDLKSDKPTDES